MPEDLLTLAPPAPDLRIAYGAHPCQFGHLRLPKGKGRGALVMNIHGGFWRNKYDLTHAGHFCAALSALEFTTWNIEYRRVGDAGGGWPGSFEDVLQAWRFIPQLSRNNKLSISKSVVVGHSAGGQLAFCLAAHEPSISAVVSLAGVVDLQTAWELQLSGNAVGEFMGGSPEEIPQFYGAADPKKLSIPQARQWLIHGSRDDVVPINFSRAYCEQKKAEKVSLLEVAGADHFDVIDPRSRGWQTVERAITDLARGDSDAQ